MLVKCITCPDCSTTIFSRTQHDFRHCSCGNYAIDGGLLEFRVLFPNGRREPEIFKIEIDATALELYNDWNLSKNKYGRITSTQLEFLRNRSN
jgi:hypothetical protein